MEFVPLKATKLEEKIAIYEAMITSTADGLAVTDREGRILFMNPAAGKMLKFDTLKAIGQQYTKIARAADKNSQFIPPDKRPLKTVIRTGQSFTNSTANYYIRSDDTKFPAAITTSAIILKNQIIGAIITFRDITHEKEVDRIKTEFLSLASHQLRTPLSAIRWFLEMLLAGDAGPINSEQTEFLKNIDQSTNRMIQLVNDLLNITRIESGRIIIEPRPTHLGKLIQEVLSELRPKIETKKQKIIVSMHPHLSAVNIDPNFIRAVYLNLINNAIKYTPVGGEITVIVSKKGNEVISQITDTGYGIPLSEQKRIFEKFFRASNVVKKETEGTGLGLYLVKAIVESSKGRVWFKSQENTGTTFWFTVPASGILAKEGEVTISN